jgi:hypothetical protein
MVSFQTKNPNLGKFWRAVDWKMLIYFMAILNILQTFGIFYDHLVHFVFIWYIFPIWCIVSRKIWQPCSGMCFAEKSMYCMYPFQAKENVAKNVFHTHTKLNQS